MSAWNQGSPKLAPAPPWVREWRIGLVGLSAACAAG
jgi:hypothetical protein